MQITWPSSARGFELLNGAGIVHGHQYEHPSVHADRKRNADHAFGGQDQVAGPSHLGTPVSLVDNGGSGGRGEQARMMARMFGLQAASSGEDISLTSYQGFDYWPTQRSFVGEAISKASVRFPPRLSPIGQSDGLNNRPPQPPTAPSSSGQVGTQEAGNAGRWKDGGETNGYEWAQMPGYSFNFNNYGYG
jgi:hypothetical protein